MERCDETGLYLPPGLRRPQQMRTAIVFWHNPTRDFIMLPPHHSVPPPKGFVKVECRHAHEVEKWSSKLRDQEKRIREMTDEERYNFEAPLRKDMEDELRENLRNAKDPVNREFLAASIARLEKRRKEREKEHHESYMHVEGFEATKE